MFVHHNMAIRLANNPNECSLLTQSMQTSAESQPQAQVSPDSNILKDSARQTDLKVELENIKSRYEQARSNIQELREMYLAVKRTSEKSNKLSYDDQHVYLKLEWETEPGSLTVTGVLLDAFAGWINKAMKAISSGDFAELEVKIHCLNEFLPQAEETIVKLKEAASALILQGLNIS